MRSRPRFQADKKKKRFAPAIRTERNGRFAMWLPNPMWQFSEEETEGQITARASLYDASVSLVLFDQVDADVALESAADTMLRWFRLVQPRFQLEGRSRVPVRDTEGILLQGFYMQVGDGRVPVAHTCEIHVMRVGGVVLALCCQAPKRLFGQLESDFERVLKSLELHPESLEPPLQGPLAPAERK